MKSLRFTGDIFSSAGSLFLLLFSFVTLWVHSADTVKILVGLNTDKDRLSVKKEILLSVLVWEENYLEVNPVPLTLVVTISVWLF